MCGSGGRTFRGLSRPVPLVGNEHVKPAALRIAVLDAADVVGTCFARTLSPGHTIWSLMMALSEMPDNVVLAVWRKHDVEASEADPRFRHQSRRAVDRTE